MTHIEKQLRDSLDQHTDAMQALREAKAKHAETKHNLTMAVLDAGLVDCVTVNVGRVLRHVHHSR